MRRACVNGLLILLVFGVGCGRKTSPPVVVETDTNAASVAQKPEPQREASGTVKFQIRIDDSTALIVIAGNEYLTKELAEPMPLPIGAHTGTLKMGGHDVKACRFNVAAGKRQIIFFDEPNREAAEWAIRSGAQVVRIVVDSKERQVKEPSEVLAWPYQVVQIEFQDKAIDDADLEHVQRLQSLRDLRLFRTTTTDVGLANLRGLPALQLLILDGTKITDAGLPRLKGMPKLRHFDLLGPNVTDAGLVHLEGMDLTGLSLGT